MDAGYIARPFALERSVVAQVPAGKPSIVRTPSGALLVSYIRGYGYRHEDPERPATIEVVRSEDGGETWSQPALSP